MTDLEMTKLCAVAMGWQVYNRLVESKLWVIAPDTPPEMGEAYDPLHDDAQAMALVKKFALHLYKSSDLGDWIVEEPRYAVSCGMYAEGDLNRAIVECVAKLQAGK